MAHDLRDSNEPHFFVTEDHKRGALRRASPPCNFEPSWNLLHIEAPIDYLEFLPGNKFSWTSSLEKGRVSAETYYPNTEGIAFDEDTGILSFVSKIKKKVFHLDLDAGTYTEESTYRGIFENGGNFGAQPDQLVQHGDLLYFTEDGGKFKLLDSCKILLLFLFNVLLHTGSTPGVYATDGTQYYALVEAVHDRYKNDETTGLAFSPDGFKMYVCLQENGHLFEVTRTDGLPFHYGHISGLRVHETYE
jgi:hypothetical protein